MGTNKGKRYDDELKELTPNEVCRDEDLRGKIARVWCFDHCGLCSTLGDCEAAIRDFGESADKLLEVIRPYLREPREEVKTPEIAEQPNFSLRTPEESLNDCRRDFEAWAKQNDYSHPHNGNGRSPMLVFAEKAWNAAWELQDARVKACLL